MSTTPADRRDVVRVLASRAFIATLAIALLVAVFAVLLPDTFLTLTNFKSILQQQATLIVLAIGVTFVLVIGEFDLSFSFTIGLTSAVAVLSMTSFHAPPLLAGALALLVGALIGTINGLAVAWGKAPAFIATLAIGSAAAGIEQLLTGNKTISSRIPLAYLEFTLQDVGGLPLSLWLTVLVVIVAIIVFRFTTYGRRLRATGMNPNAVKIAGTSVPLVKFSAFVIMGALAGFSAIMVSSLGGSYFPNSGGGLLLPPYSAVFLGAAILGRGRFSPLATLYGVVFIAVLERGLTMLSYSTAVIMLLEGTVLAAAVLLAQREKKR
jgi:ribose transport system permease protein